MRIRSALIALVLGSVLVTAALVAALILTLRLPEIVAEQKTMADHVRNSVSQAVELALSAYEAPLRLASARLARTPRDAQAILDGLLEGKTPYLAVYLIRPDGLLLLSGASANRSFRPPLGQTNLDGYPELRRAHEQNRFVWSDRFLSIVTGDVVLAVAAPAGKHILVAEIAPEYIRGVAHESMAQTPAPLLIVDGRGEWVSSNSPIFGDYRNNSTLLTALRAALDNNLSVPLQSAQFGTFSLSVSRSDRLTWSYIIALPSGFSNPVYRRTVTTIFIGFFVAFVFALLVTPFISQRFSLPLTRLAHTAAQLTANEGGRDWPHSPILEVAILTEALRKSSATLHEREVMLGDLNNTLEARVAARTAELSRSNESLGLAMASLKETQNELVRAEKLAALGSLVAGVAHEINTPIGNALMASSTLYDSTRELEQKLAQGLRRSELISYASQACEASQMTLQNLERAADLIRNFKQVAVDQTSENRRRFLLDELVRGILLTLEPAFRHCPCRLVSEIPKNIAMDSFPGAIGQVLTNLVENARIHAFDEKSPGQISVLARTTETGSVILTVADDGKGIPPDILPRIFDPFVTTRPGTGGSGLGLHITHNLVTGVLRGRIDVESELQRGTRFLLTLPCLAA